MPYRYGDSTPFPLDENFIETLRDLIHAGVDILAAQEKIEHSQRLAATIAEEEKVASEKLGEIKNGLTTVLAPFEQDTNAQIRRVAMQAAQAALHQVEEAITRARQRAAAGREEVSVALAGHRADVHRALESFFVTRALPHTSWTYSWMSLLDGGVTAHAEGRHETGFEMAMELDVPASHTLAKMPRVADLHKGVHVMLPERGGWLRRSGIRRRNVDSYHVIGIEVTTKHLVAVIARSAKSRSSSYRILMGTDEAVPPSVIPSDESGRSGGEGFAQDGAEANEIRRLAVVLGNAIEDLASRRVTLLSASLDGTDLTEVESATTIVERMISAVAPFVREIRNRGSSRGELVLKQDTGDGRREEVYVPRNELATKIATLRPEHRALFTPFALAKETIELRDGDFSAITTAITASADIDSAVTRPDLKLVKKSK
ncbi:hypothetical protein ACFL6C_03490 [Myxococcota bacterium]